MSSKPYALRASVYSAAVVLATTAGLYLGHGRGGEISPILLHKGTFMPNDPDISNLIEVVVPAQARAVNAFWREAGPSKWFAKDPVFDAHFRTRFLAAHQAAANGQLSEWRKSAEGALALVILLDQFPRNAFRGTERMYATDQIARHIADEAIRKGHDLKLENDMALFLYLPFGHSEAMADQERSVALAERLGEPALSHARHHRTIVQRFGRFPHRNPIVGREMKADEQRFLDEGGFAG